MRAHRRRSSKASSRPSRTIQCPCRSKSCARLSILRIEDLDTVEFEGGLVTDAKRSEVTILVKRGGKSRRCFTIAHELVQLPDGVPRTGSVGPVPA